MRRHIVLAAAIAIAACSNSSAPGDKKEPKLDPYVTVRVRNQLDTTTAAGRAHWHVYAILTGPITPQNGVGFSGAISLQDVRLHHERLCVGVGADSIGTRLVSVLAIADTMTVALTHDTTAARMAQEWFAGDTTLDAGWAALHNAPTDAWDSQQFAAGRGLVPSDPIRWQLDWLAPGSVNFYERIDTEQECDHF